MQEQASVRPIPLDAVAKPRPKTPDLLEVVAPKPSEHLAEEERVRRHRERAIASWLRSLGR